LELSIANFRRFTAKCFGKSINLARE